jgi:hypothetical protein
MTLHIARWQEFGSAEPYLSSEELQAQLVSLYSKILSYSAHFVRRAGPPLVKNTSWKQKVDSLFEDIKQLAVVLEWTADTVQMRAQVLADAGLPEETCRPKGVEELILLVVNSLVPEDSMRTSTAYISEVYAQYLATMVSYILVLLAVGTLIRDAAIRKPTSSLKSPGQEHQPSCRRARCNDRFSEISAKSLITFERRKQRPRYTKCHITKARVLSF